MVQVLHLFPDFRRGHDETASGIWAEWAEERPPWGRVPPERERSPAGRGASEAGKSLMQKLWRALGR